MTVKPMLAVAWDGADLAYPLLASPKLDGVRALVLGGVVVSRSLKPIPNAAVQARFGKADFEGLDGELIVGDAAHPDVYRRTTSGVMSALGTPDVRFFVFDDLSAPGGFAARLASAAQRCCGAAVALDHISLPDAEALAAYEAAQVAAGYEGIMLRAPDAPYKHGRVSKTDGSFLKVKRFEDAEAEVLDAIELCHNLNAATVNALGQTERSVAQAGRVPGGVLGALSVRLPSGVTFEIGTGFTAAERAALWARRDRLPGKLVKFKFQPAGTAQKPRFPVFLGFRDRRDGDAA